MDKLVAVLTALYDSEINVTLESFWDGGWTAKLGDDMNGFESEKHFRNKDLADVAPWLAQEAMRLYPDSTFAKTWAADPVV